MYSSYSAVALALRATKSSSCAHSTYHHHGGKAARRRRRWRCALAEYEKALRLHFAMSLSFSAPGDVPVRMLYDATAADAWAWGFRATERDAQVVFSNPTADDHDDGLNCGPLLAAVAIKELPGWIIESPCPVRLIDAPHFTVPQG
uniref:DUF642 domain-containing protein n=1 Tax=Oryza punctata TaxID=4537 RepID=A0A0E0MLD9_ORYPU